MAKDRRKRRRAAVGIALAALVAGGGVIAGASLAGPTLSAAPAASTGTGSGGTGSGGTGSGGTGSAGSAGTGSGGTGSAGSAGTGGSGTASQAALLDSTLNAADLPTATVVTGGGGPSAPASTPAATPGAGTGAAASAPAVRRCARFARAARVARQAGHPRLSRAARAATVRCRFIRRRIARFFLLRGVDGQFTFRARNGDIRTLAYERGVIESVSGSFIVVKAADGTIWTWDIVGNTVVRDMSGKISESALAVGGPVWVGGPVVSGAKDARLIFVRPPGG